MDKIRVIFILPQNCNDETEAPIMMREAYEACVDFVANVQWVKENDYTSIDLNKTDFLIFNEFKGKNFESLKETKCAILGPWCVSICLSEGRPIPNYPWPIYNVAMHSCVVSCSHLPKKTKLQIKEKVQLMGGCYTETLVSGNTHLITDNVRTEKYVLAVEAGVIIMLPSWVDAVWEDSQTANIRADDEKYSKLKCSPFQNLVVCSTGVTNIYERQELSELVTKHGGKFTATLALADTDILVCKGTAGTTSEKYKAARNSKNIQCVTIEWVKQSAEKGYALPCTKFQVQKGTSTPKKGDDEEAIDPDFSRFSVISAPQLENRTTFEETVNSSTASNCNFKPQKQLHFGQITPTKRQSNLQRKGLLKDEYIHLVKGIDIKAAKKAGHYLDGCNVYIAGFGTEQREKLCKVLNLSGATRYDDLSDRLSHVIIGDTNCADLKVIKSRGYSCSLVTVRWLIECIKNHKPVEEEEYLISTNSMDSIGAGSPLSKKGLSLLRSNRTITEQDFNAEETTMDVETLQHEEQDPENDIMQQYLRENTNEEDTLANLLKNADTLKSVMGPPPPQKEESTQQTETYTMDDEESHPLDIFEGLKFAIADFTDENFNSLKETIESAAGSVVSKSYRGIPDFAVVPIFNRDDLTNITATEIVNELYITECIQERESIEINYYHRPFVLQASLTPINDCVIAISGYCSYERSFLSNLIIELGGVSQDQFSRITCVEKNVKPCTHLVSAEASGKKYLAALKWKLPVVNKDWLIECARLGRYLPEDPYLIGDSKASNIKRVSEVSLTSTGVISTVSNNSNKPEGKSVSSPLVKKHPLRDDAVNITPVTKFRKSSKNTPETCSQVTPVRKMMEEARMNHLLGTPESPPMPRAWNDVDTPETPLGAFIRPNPSPNLRKEMAVWLNQFPDYVPPKPRRMSTPLSELKRRLLQKFLTGGCTSSQENNQNEVNKPPGQPDFNDVSDMECAPLPDDDDDDDNNVDQAPQDENAETPEKLMIHNKLNLLEQMLSESKEKKHRESRSFRCTVPAPANPEIKDSQAFTVGWDYMVDEDPKPQEKLVKIFMLSGIEVSCREEITKSIEALGGAASDLATYDPSSTHLICAKPARNEKALACMAAGKWILHISFIEKSIQAGKFLDEEEYEYGNPKSKGNIPGNWDHDTEIRINAMFWWRKEIFRRRYGAFKDMKAIVIAGKRDPIIRVIEAGGGTIVNVTPPFDDDEVVDATHCLIEPRSVSDFSDYFPLAKQGIYCVNTMYISDHLHRNNKDIKDCILPYFAKYYT